MIKKVIKRLKILVLEVIAEPTGVVVHDANGNIGTADINGFGGGGARDVDGGFANAAYLASQNSDGGSAATSAGNRLDGGNS